MHWPDHLSLVALERQARIREEMRQISLIRLMPRPRPRWQLWLARSMVKWGGRLTRWGTAVAEPPCPETMSIRLAVSLRQAKASTACDGG